MEGKGDAVAGGEEGSGRRRPGPRGDEAAGTAIQGAGDGEPRGEVGGVRAPRAGSGPRGPWRRRRERAAGSGDVAASYWTGAAAGKRPAGPDVSGGAGWKKTRV